MSVSMVSSAEAQNFEIKKFFKELDADGSGTLSIDEIKDVRNEIELILQFLLHSVCNNIGNDEITWWGRSDWRGSVPYVQRYGH